jgi:hypothetical protein
VDLSVHPDDAEERRCGGACFARGECVAAAAANVAGGSERNDDSVQRAIVLLPVEAEAAGVRVAGGEGGEEAGEGVFVVGGISVLLTLFLSPFPLKIIK